MEPRKFKQYLERFSAQLAKLSQRQRAGMAALLNRSLLQEKTAALIEASAVRRHCPHCHSAHLHRHGHAAGLQRYRCANCARTFNALTGTPLARLRHRGKWLSFLDSMLASNSVRRAAALAGVHKNTSFRWRHRCLTNTKGDRLWPLGGITEADETYLLESQKGSRHLNRPPRRRGGTAKRRGLSAEQVCILVARDRTGKTFDFVTGRAPLTRVHLRRCLAPPLPHQHQGRPALAARGNNRGRRDLSARIAEGFAPSGPAAAAAWRHGKAPRTFL